jgi:hypothetical protein
VIDSDRRNYMFGEPVIYYIGAATSVLIALIVLCILWGAILGLLAYKANIFVFPRFTFFLLEKMRSVFKVLFSFFSRDRFLVERIAIKILNHLHRRRYSEIPAAERMVIMPQCLRDLECPARLDPELGLDCKRCGRCVIDRVRKLNGTSKIYISPGGTFAVRILESKLPRAVLGVACPHDLFEGMAVCHSLRIPVQGVSLLRTGCVATEVDFDEVAQTLLMGDEQGNAQGEKRHTADN